MYLLLRLSWTPSLKARIKDGKIVRYIFLEIMEEYRKSDKK